MTLSQRQRATSPLGRMSRVPVSAGRLSGALRTLPQTQIRPKNSEQMQPVAKPKLIGQHVPIERWFARFAVLVGGKLAWLTTCEQGRSLLFRYTSHFVILAVLVGVIGLVSTAKATSAADNPAGRPANLRVLNAAVTPPTSSSDSDEIL